MPRLAGTLLLVVVSHVACLGGPNGPDATAARARTAPVQGKEPAHSAPAPSPKPAFIEAGEGDADAVVRDAMHAAQQQERRLVVYVGATWCEPCQAFHDAVERGELDDALTGVRFLEFDSDRDGDRLGTAGYSGRYIPRFVIPRADGQASDQRMEGGIKGAGAVANIMERLGPLLAGS